MARQKVVREFLYRQEVADILGVSLPRIVQMDTGAYPIPRNDAGQYPLKSFGTWFRARVLRETRADYRPSVEEMGGENPVEATRDLRREKDIQSARKDAAMAEKNELENAVRRGELVEAAEVIAGWQTILSRVKSRMLQIPSVAAPLVIGESDQHTIRQILDDMVRDALLELSAPEPAEDAAPDGE